MNISFSMNKTNKKTKPFKIKTVIFQRIGRVILWTLIIFLIFRGIGSLFNKNEAAEAEVLINEFISTADYKDEVEREAAAFAERFAREYFTYDRNDISDYEKRVKSFVPSYVSIDARNYGNGKTNVLNTNVYNVEWFKDNQLNVYVSAKIQYDQEIQEDEETVRQVIEDDVSIVVPIMEKEGQYAVEDLPAIITVPQKANINGEYYTGATVSDERSDQIESVLENFFKTYYSGNSGEISYYMHENQNINGLEGRYSLISLGSVRTFEAKAENEYFSIVNLSIEDAISKVHFNQNFNVSLVQKDGRYYIKDFDIRAVNINNKEEI